MNKGFYQSHLKFLWMSFLFPGILAAATPQKSLSILTQVETSSNLYADNQYERQSSNSLTLGPSFQLSKYWASSARIAVVKENNSTGRTIFANTPVTISYSGYSLGVFDLKNKILGTLPTDQESRKNDTYQGSLGVGADLIYQGKNHILPTTILLGLALNRNFHEYSQNNEGNPNIQYAIRNIIDLSMGITSKTNLSVMASYKTAWTYENSTRSSFLASTSLEYEIFKTFNVYGGTSTGERAAFKSNGIDSNMTLFDEKTSEIFMGLTYIY